MNHNAVEEMWMRAYCTALHAALERNALRSIAPDYTASAVAVAQAERAVDDFTARFPRWVPR
jgi:hypothetical protein